MRNMDKHYMLPDGTLFAMWHDETQYSKVLHVCQKRGSMQGDGSEAHPFLTIEQAVPLAEPGTKVVIHEGVYRETVRPVISGKSEREMVMFCGAEGERVEITGAEYFCGTFRDSEGWKRQDSPVRDELDFQQKEAKVYMAKFDRKAFVGVNPFSMANGPLIPWYNSRVGKLYHAKHDRSKQTTTLRRGMLFCDGERVEQVLNYFQLGEKDNRYFVEDDGLTFHIRFKNDTEPDGHCLEFTAREQCFCPEEKYFSYFHLQNLRFTKAGNGFPPPQRGALSTNCGHHWLIEDCQVLHANGVGADIGFQCPTRFSNKPRGYHIVRNSAFSYCGIAGLVGTPGGSDIHYCNNQMESVLVEGCHFVDNCWYDFEEMWENGSLKLHHLKDSLLLNNFVNGTQFGSGIWTDAFNTNLRIEGNVVLHTKNQFGSIFVEASKDDVLVKHNIVVDSKQNLDPIQKDDDGGNGLFSLTCEDVKTVRNIVLGCEHHGIVHHYTPQQRIDGGSGCTGRGFDTIENIVSHCTHLVALGTEHCVVDGNIYGRSYEEAPLRIQVPTSWNDLQHWRKNFQFDKNGRMADISYVLENDARLLLTIDGATYSIDLTKRIAEQIDGIFENI